LQGEWSRLELMRSPEAFSQSAIRGFLAQLPLNAHSIYFKDAIGNISSSQVCRRRETASPERPEAMRGLMKLTTAYAS